MKNRIIEICELGEPQSIIHRENEPITELIKTDDLIKELNEQLLLYNVSKSLPPDTDGCSNDRDKCSCKNWGGCPVN